MPQRLQVSGERFILSVSRVKKTEGKGEISDAEKDAAEPVSYTHLTLPTIYSV